MSPRSSTLKKFLIKDYPHMHMKIYDALCVNKKFRDNFPNIINDLIGNPEKTIKSIRTQAKKDKDSRVGFALRILATLSEKGNENILRQMKKNVNHEIIKAPTKGIIFQLSESDRWEKRYGEATYDLVIGLPEFRKIISISTSEVKIPLEPLIPRLSEIILENVHVYTFFNRAHAVRGRRVESKKGQHSSQIGKITPFLRTSKDIEMIGKSMNLNFFTPFLTIEGLRLGFFFVLVCDIGEIKWLKSPSGYGYNPYQSCLNLNDSMGSLTAKMNAAVLQEGMDKINSKYDLNLKKGQDLLKLENQLMIFGVWIFGKSVPEIAFFTVADQNLKIDEWSLLSFLNTHRKTGYDLLRNQFTKKCIKEVCERDQNLVKINQWVYYKETEWPADVLEALEKNDFSCAMTLGKALQYGLNYDDYKIWIKNKIPKFFRINPDLRDLYRADIPQDIFKEINEKISHLEEKKEPEINTETRIIMLKEYRTRNIAHIKIVSSKINKLGCSVWDLFNPEWENGGYALEKRWLSMRKNTDKIDEISSAIIFIISMRGAVNIPECVLT